jgi:hypothetical protein
MKRRGKKEIVPAMYFDGVWRTYPRFLKMARVTHWIRYPEPPIEN